MENNTKSLVSALFTFLSAIVIYSLPIIKPETFATRELQIIIVMLAIILNGIFVFICLRIIDSVRLKISILKGNHKVTEDRLKYAQNEIARAQTYSNNLQKELNRILEKYNI